MWLESGRIRRSAKAYGEILTTGSNPVLPSKTFKLMISKETLKAVNQGVLTDDQLREALNHYKSLEENISCHGEIYQIFRFHVGLTYDSLKSMARFRNWKNI